jgi:hypothetical protein
MATGDEYRVKAADISEIRAQLRFDLEHWRCSIFAWLIMPTAGTRILAKAMKLPKRCNSNNRSRQAIPINNPRNFSRLVRRAANRRSRPAGVPL